MDARNSNVFREIHKNTWLKRLSVDNKKVLVGPKKSERSWVVFCVHDDSEAILEGYVEPRQAAQHQPEWTVPLQHALHVSHSLVPSEHEYEFVVTLPAEVVRFNAPTWDVMLEWVDTLRQKLREMKIMSPKENLYSRLPELRAPLLPTRDPQSPLPAPPPVPAALVPGIERILPATAATTSLATATATTAATTSDAAAGGVSVTGTTTTTTSAATCPASITSSMPASAMSNTLTQNLINMLSNPVVSAYNAQPSTSHHHHHENSVSLEDSFFAEDEDDDDDDEGGRGVNDETANNGHADDTVGNVARGASDPSASSSSSSSGAGPSGTSQLQPQTSMARIFVDNVLADPNTCLVKEHVDAEAIGRGATPKNRHPAAEADASGLDSIGSTVFQSEPIIIPRPQTSRSSAREKAPAKRRVVTSTTGTAFKTAASPVLASVVPTDSVPSIAVAVQPETVPADSASASASNITIIQVSSPHIKPSTTGETFQFPSGSGVPDQLPSTSIDVHDDQFTSNVHIIPSNPTAAITQPQPVTTVQVSGATVDSTGPSAVDSGYGQLKQIVQSASDSGDSTATNVTNVTTGGASLLIGSSAMSPAIATIAPTSARPLAVSSFGGTVTHIPIGDHSLSSAYEPLFVATARPPAAFPSPKPVPKLRTTGSSGVTPSRRFAGRTADQRQAAVVAAPRNANTVTVSGPSTSTAAVSSSLPSVSDGSSAVTCSSSSALHVHSNNNQTSVSATMTTTTTVPTPSTSAQSAATATTSSSNKLVTTMRDNLSSPLPVIRKLLTRGLTDMSITRPSRSRDPQSAHVATASPSPAAASAVVVSTSRLAVETPTQRSRPTAAGPAALASEQRRRSSSHSEAQRGRNLVATGAPQQQRSHNNGHNNLNNNSSEHQQSQQMHRSPLVPKHAALTGGASGAGPSNNGGGGGGGSRMTLREQQVLELRKEMRHLGGVRIQLRRKDCQGSIALCDAFGAVWVCGWKQKDHPILYYALHIGDQVVQVAGCTVACTADVQRIIRNVQGLYIDFILRRLPFGRVYAIRRDMENQCLGLIRDGNTATIVDVVPKSLSARHGLPPKAPSCDGLSLTFWVLTEINGRPLNLFFKDTEVRDRLNASGRDISVLVQPADLIAKLKKHLKSMRGYKDYIVQ